MVQYRATLARNGHYVEENDWTDEASALGKFDFLMITNLDDPSAVVRLERQRDREYTRDVRMWTQKDGEKEL